MNVDATIAGLIGAAIGAISSLMGSLLVGWQQSRIERQRWLRARDDKLIQDLQLAIVELTRKLAAGIHSMQWFMWVTEYQPEKFTIEQLNEKLRDYNNEVHDLFPELTGSLMVIAALDKDMYNRMSPLVNEFIELDWQIAMIAVSQDDSFSKSVEALASCYSKVSEYEKRLHECVSEIIGIRKIDRK